MENADNAFTMMPMNQKISLQPGEVYHGSITIVNPSYATKDFRYQASVTPYGVIGEDYTIDLTHESDYTAISKWTKIEEPTGVIKPGESKKINFTISVPKDVPGGGQYATITVSPDEKASENSGVSIQNIYEMASIIYADVAGETHHEGQVLENNVPSFVLTTPITLSSRLNNEGNVHETAYYTFKVTDAFSGRVIIPSEEAPGVFSEVIMPETTRFAEHIIDNLPELGIVKVTQSINYNGQTTTEEKNVIICPAWFIILISVVVIMIISSVVLIIRKHRRKRNSIE